MAIRHISTATWNDQKFLALSSDAKVVFLMCITHPCTSRLGVMRGFTQPALAREARVSEDAFNKAFDALLKSGLIRFSEDNFLIWVPNFMRYNMPDSAQNLKTLADDLAMVPECEMRSQIIERVHAEVEAFAEKQGRTGQIWVDALPDEFFPEGRKKSPVPAKEPEPKKKDAK